MNVSRSATGYTGTVNLEAMDRAANYNAFLLNLVAARIRPADCILDFGAGTGVLARPLAAAGFQVSCVEPDEALRARLSAAGLTAYPDIQDVPAQSMDLIYTSNVLEHIADDGSAAAALRTRLKPDGLLLVYVPAFPLLFSSVDRQVGHWRRYRRGGLAALLSQAGFDVDCITYRDSLGFFAALLFKFFGNNHGTINQSGLIIYDRYLFPLSTQLDSLTGKLFGKNLFAVARRRH